MCTDNSICIVSTQVFTHFTVLSQNRMSTLPIGEEETPLLFLFINDTSTRKKNSQANNESSKPLRQPGVEWPGHITICCWVCLILLLFFSTLLVILPRPHYYPVALFSPTCQEQEPRVYTVHFGKWKTYQFQAVADMVARYPGIVVHILDLWNTTKVAGNHTTQHKKRIRKQLDINKTSLTDVLTTSKKTTMKYRRYKIRTIKSMLEHFPYVIYSKETMQSYFSETPLYSIWKVFDLDMIDLAARVIPVWRFGGISIKLPSADKSKWASETSTFGNLSTFLRTPPGAANVDERAHHMECKTPCHLFFERIISNLRAADTNDTAQTIVNATFEAFTLTHEITSLYSI